MCLSYFCTLLIIKCSVAVVPLRHVSTKLPGCETQSRIRKSPSFWTISSARGRGIGPWYQACERKSRESSDSSHSRARFKASVSAAALAVSAPLSVMSASRSLTLLLCLWRDDDDGSALAPSNWYLGWCNGDND